MGITPRPNRCDPPDNPFLSYTPVSTTTSATASLPNVSLPNSGALRPDYATTYPCGSMFFPNGDSTTITINGVASATFTHGIEAYITNEEKLKTQSNTISYGSSLFPSDIYLQFSNTYITNPIHITGAFKIQLRKTTGELIAVKYVNDHDDNTILDKGNINFTSTDILNTEDLAGQQVILEVESLCFTEGLSF